MNEYYLLDVSNVRPLLIINILLLWFFHFELKCVFSSCFLVAKCICTLVLYVCRILRRTPVLWICISPESLWSFTVAQKAAARQPSWTTLKHCGWGVLQRGRWQTERHTVTHFIHKTWEICSETHLHECRVVQFLLTLIWTNNQHYSFIFIFRACHIGCPSHII